VPMLDGDRSRFADRAGTKNSTLRGGLLKNRENIPNRGRRLLHHTRPGPLVAANVGSFIYSARATLPATEWCEARIRRA